MNIKASEVCKCTKNAIFEKYTPTHVSALFSCNIYIAAFRTHLAQHATKHHHHASCVIHGILGTTPPPPHQGPYTLKSTAAFPPLAAHICMSNDCQEMRWISIWSTHWWPPLRRNDQNLRQGCLKSRIVCHARLFPVPSSLANVWLPATRFINCVC
jgi:hypothetical protein